MNRLEKVWLEEQNEKLALPLSKYSTAENGPRTLEGRKDVIGGKRSIEAEHKTRDLIIVDLWTWAILLILKNLSWKLFVRVRFVTNEIAIRRYSRYLVRFIKDVNQAVRRIYKKSALYKENNLVSSI